MDTRILHTVAIAIAAVVGGFYYYSGKSVKLETHTTQDISSTASNIHVIQTDDQGRLYARAQIQDMTLWIKDGRTNFSTIQGLLFKDGVPSTSFHADAGSAWDNYKNMQLKGNVSLSQLNPDQTTNITFKTETLSGDTKTNQIQTQDLVFVTHPQAQFTSQGLNVNLNSSQYDFFNIRGQYEPASR